MGQKIKTRQKLSFTAMIMHGTIIVVTCGLWYPVYLAARRKRIQVTYMPTGGIDVNTGDHR